MWSVDPDVEEIVDDVSNCDDIQVTLHGLFIMCSCCCYHCCCLLHLAIVQSSGHSYC